MNIGFILLIMASIYTIYILYKFRQLVLSISTDSDTVPDGNYVKSGTVYNSKGTAIGMTGISSHTNCSSIPAINSPTVSSTKSVNPGPMGIPGQKGIPGPWANHSLPILIDDSLNVSVFMVTHTNDEVISKIHERGIWLGENNIQQTIVLGPRLQVQYQFKDEHEAMMFKLAWA